MKNKVMDLPVADWGGDYAGHYADIVPNGSEPLPWSIVLVSKDGCRRLCDCGSFDAAVRNFEEKKLRKL